MTTPTEPLTGAIWTLAPSSPFRGRHLAVAGAIDGGIVVLLCTEHAADPQLDDLELREGDVRWLEPSGNEPALRSLSGAGAVAVRREHFGERVATLPRAMVPALREEVRRRFHPTLSDFADPTPERPAIPLTAQFLEDLAVITALHAAFFHAAREPAPETRPSALGQLAARIGASFELRRLRPAMQAILGTDVRRAFAAEDGTVLAEVRGTGGGNSAVLRVFEEAELGTDPVVAVIADAEEHVLAWHVFNDPSGDVSAEIEVPVDLAVAGDATLILGRLAATAGDPDAPQTWPPWRGDPDPSSVAGYVSSLALRGTVLVTGGAAQVRKGISSDAEADRAVAEHLYALLQGRGIAYALDPYVAPPGEWQQVRDPRWLAEDKVGTCIDMATTFASMCLDAKVAPFVVISPGHATVVLALDRLISNRPPPRPPGTKPTGLAGHRIIDPAPLLDAIDAGRFLPVDATGAAVGEDLSFAEAQVAARNELRPGAVLVDIIAAHANGIAPVPAPRGRPAITTYVGRGSRAQDLFSNQAELVRALTGLSGVAVVIAPQGQGKSTVGRELVHLASSGAGWFLDASSPKRLVESLADAELQQRNQTSEKLTPGSRDEFAVSALGRLAETPAPWLVVFDNADGAPDTLAQLIPAAGPGQLVVVTTTNDDWRALAPAQTFELAPIDPREVLPVVHDDALLELVGGRALMVDAFGRFLTSGGTTTAVRHHDPGPAAGVERGPIALVRSVAEAHPDLTEGSAIAALLPPDQLPVEVLDSLVGADTPAGLLRAGLLTREVRDAARMHRLVGAAVRAVHEPSLPAAAARLAELDDACRAFDRWADPETVERFVSLLEQSDREDAPTSRVQALRFFRVATMLETKGSTKLSDQLYRRAGLHFDPAAEDDAELLAVCWHGQARYLYQQFPRDVEKLEEALILARQAEESFARARGAGAAGRFLAMQGLIQKALATAIGGPRARRAQRLAEALRTLDEADRRRRNDPGVDQAELLRSRYNLAGIRIDLAKVAAAAETRRLLEQALDIYEDVRAARKALYRRPLHPHIAACEHGIGITHFYAALLIDQPQAERIARLRAATAATTLGLQHREQLAGSLDGPDVKKSLALLEKISAVRLGLLVTPETVTREALERVHTDALEDITADLADAEVVHG